MYGAAKENDLKKSTFVHPCDFRMAFHIFMSRVQKQRATKSQDALEQLTSQLLEKDAQFEELRSQLEDLHPRYDKVCKEKSQILAENSALKT